MTWLGWIAALVSHVRCDDVFGGLKSRSRKRGAGICSHASSTLAILRVRLSETPTDNQTG